MKEIWPRGGGADFVLLIQYILELLTFYLPMHLANNFSYFKKKFVLFHSQLSEYRNVHTTKKQCYHVKLFRTHCTCLVKHTWYDDISTREKSRYFYSHDYLICGTKSLQRFKLTTKLTASCGFLRWQVKYCYPAIEKLYIYTLKRYEISVDVMDSLSKTFNLWFLCYDRLNVKLQCLYITLNLWETIHLCVEFYTTLRFHHFVPVV